MRSISILQRLYPRARIHVASSPLQAAIIEAKRIYEALPDCMILQNRSAHIEYNNGRLSLNRGMSAVIWDVGRSTPAQGMGFIWDTPLTRLADAHWRTYRFPRNVPEIAEFRTLAVTVRRNLFMFSTWGGNASRPMSVDKIAREDADILGSELMTVLTSWSGNGGSSHIGDVIAVKAPTVVRMNNEGQISALHEPAIEFADGYSIYAIDGILTRKHPVRRFTKHFIAHSRNAEERRVLIETVGFNNYVDLCNGLMLQSDGYGELYQFPALPRDDEGLRMVKVVNSTPEPDGTYKDYFLRVPPNMETAEQAVAWTFGIEAGKFDMVAQT